MSSTRKSVKAQASDIPIDAILEFFGWAQMFFDGQPNGWTEDRIDKAQRLNEWLKAVDQGGE